MKLRKRISLILFLLVAVLTASDICRADERIVVERDDWMGIYFSGRKLGFSHLSVKRAHEGLQVDSQVYLRLRSESMDQVTSFTQETVLDENYNLKSFSLLQEIMGNRHQTRGRMIDSALVMSVTSTGYEKEETISFKPGAAISSTYFINILKDGLRVGNKGRIPIFMEALRTFSEIEYEIMKKRSIPYDDKMLEVYEIHQRIAGMETILWVTQNGTVIREVSQDGFESLMEPMEKAQDLGKETVAVSSLITLSLVKPQREIKNPENNRQMIARLLNLRSPKSVPQDHRQSILKAEPMSDGMYEVTLKIKSEKLGVPNPQYPEYFPDPALLSDNPEIQSKHPLIMALAREITDKEKDAWQAAQGINEWVYRNLEKVLVDTLTAVDTLNQRRGECQAHTNLFVALARASGIPARVVNGLVYSKEYKGFVYHAWPEVYVGEWRSLDPTFGQNLVDATHIKLGEGNQDAPLKLMEFIGKLEIRLAEGPDMP